MRWWWGSLCTRPIRLLGFIVLAHFNNNPRIDMSPHSDTLAWFRANQSLPFLLNAACLGEKQQKLTCSHHDIVKYCFELALNSNHSILSHACLSKTNGQMIKINQVRVIYSTEFTIFLQKKWIFNLKYFPGKFGNPGKSNSCPGSLSKGSILRRLQEKSGAMACMNVVAFKHVGMILGFVNLDRILLSESPIFRWLINKGKQHSSTATFLTRLFKKIVFSGMVPF
jgi:hypothetical protein